MRIIDMVNARFSGGAERAERTAQSGNGFDILLAQAERRQVDAPTENRNRDDGNRNREQNRTNETRREIQHTRREEPPRNDDTASTAGTAVVQTQNAANETSANGEITQACETQIIEEVAAVLQIPIDALTEILQELDLTAQDLTDAQNVTKVLQIALEAETPAELLTDPEFPELYKAVNEVVAQAIVQYAPKQVVNESATKVLAGEETVNILAEELDGVEVKIENDEVVVQSEQRATNSQTQTRPSYTQTQASDAQTQTADAGVEAADANPTAQNENAAPDQQVVIQPLSIENAAAKTAQAISQNTPQQPVNTANVIEQIMNQVKVVNIGGQFTEMRMTLRPETLGDIVLRVITQNGIVMAQFEAESQRVKEALEADFNLLRDALTESGIKFSELSVSVRQDENERLNQFERERQRSRHRANTIENVAEEETVSYHNGVIDLTA